MQSGLKSHMLPLGIFLHDRECPPRGKRNCDKMQQQRSTGENGKRWITSRSSIHADLTNRIALAVLYDL